MFAAHLAAGLALRGPAPRAPAWALLTGAFVPDLVWIALARAGVDPADAVRYFDEWSHSVVSILVMAVLFALLLHRYGRRAQVAGFVAVASHAVLDAVVHPAPLALYPHASLHAAWDLWAWGGQRPLLGFTNYFWIQAIVTLLLLVAYVVAARRRAVEGRLIAASCLVVTGLQLLV